MSLPKKGNDMRDLLQQFVSLHVLDVTNARKQSTVLTFLLENKNQ